MTNITAKNEVGSARRYLRGTVPVRLHLRACRTNLDRGDYQLLLSIADRIDEVAAAESPDFNALEVLLSEATKAIDLVKLRTELAASTTETNI
jgi:hypothetical protein